MSASSCSLPQLRTRPAACPLLTRHHGLGPILRSRQAPQQIVCSASKPWTGAGSTPTEVAVYPTAARAAVQQKSRMRVAVLGSGWGAASFLRNIDSKAFGDKGPFELVVVSPRNYFLFTPLLPSAMAGTVEERSLVAPIRELTHGKGTYYEAECIDIDPHAQVLTCRMLERQRPNASAEGQNGDHVFQLPYDVLLLAVGSLNNTLGVAGVREHCWFLKTMEDARKLRVHISKVIEMAGLPSTTPEERKKFLSFLVVGGGPTGVEVAAELHDLVAEDVARQYPSIKGDVSITLVHSMDKVLNAFHEEVSQYAGKLLTREGVQLKLLSSVKEVKDGSARVKHRDGTEETLEFGTCVWATGIAAHPLVGVLREKLGAAAQGNPQGLVVNARLQVKGSGGSILALGDAAITNQAKAAEHGQALFEEGDKDQDGRLSPKELQTLLTQAQDKYQQLGDLALQLDSSLPGAVGRLLFPNSAAERLAAKHRAKIRAGLDLEAFQELLVDADSASRPLPPTAQVARQEGEYLASMFSQKLVRRGQPAAGGQEAAGGQDGAGPEQSVEMGGWPFMYFHLGCLAYLGSNRAIMQLPPTPLPVATLKGLLAAHIWRALELFMQVSSRNRWMIVNDWLRTSLWGRNMSDF